METTLQHRSSMGVAGRVWLIAAAALACERSAPPAVTTTDSPSSVAIQQTASDTLLHTPVVTDTSVSFVVPVPECTAKTARDSTDRVRSGARLFLARNCDRCHNLYQGYADGPDLRGVAERRSCDWVVALLTDTENMIQTDPDLQQLRIEHFLDMPDHKLSVLEARAIYAFLRAATVPDTAQR
jgi:cytochrome c2